jgi:sarcosine oxidase
VAGAGVFGAAIADRLAGEGFEVTLVERAYPGHEGAESGGESRLIRCSHGGDELYTASARRARELWLELDERLIVESGVAWFARSEDGFEAESERVLRAQGIPVERPAPEELFPSLHTDDLAFALFEPEAGVLRAAEATRALGDRAQARGATLVRGEARPDGGAVVVGGERLEADLVVWACGAWMAGLFPDLVELRVTLQEVTFFEAPAEWDRVPGFVDYDGAVYGCGPLDGCGMKVAIDEDGPPVDPDRHPAESQATAGKAADYLAHRFPALAGAQLQRAKTCHYSISRDMSFIFDRHPEHDRVWLAGGGSGHGFKHGPAFAEGAVAVMTGAAEPEPRFAVGPRGAGRSLRTAGWQPGTAE